MLRFEHLKFVPMPMKQWNRSIVTPMRLVHTLTPETDCPMKKKQRLQTATAPLSLRDGTRLTMIREATSPYMRKDVNHSTPQPLLVVVSYSHAPSKAQSPYKVSIVGTIHDLHEVWFPHSGKLHRKFKLADEQGNWVHCVARGRHAENNSLESFLRIVIYFGSGILATRHAPQAIALFEDAFIIPLQRRSNPPPLSQQVKWQ